MFHRRSSSVNLSDRSSRLFMSDRLTRQPPNIANGKSPPEPDQHYGVLSYRVSPHLREGNDSGIIAPSVIDISRIATVTSI